MNENKVCPATGFQKVEICVPVTVKPFAKTGTTVTKCYGEPIVTPGIVTCEGTKNGECFFTISQKICVQVPVEFGAESSTGDTFINCLDASSENICLDCNKDLEESDDTIFTNINKTSKKNR